MFITGNFFMSLGGDLLLMSYKIFYNVEKGGFFLDKCSGNRLKKGEI